MSLGTTQHGLVGRARELRLVDEALDAMRAGAGGTLLFSGEPGSGKTSLLEAARERAGDALVLTCRGVEWEAELPFSGLHELLAPLFDTIDQLADHQGRALATALGLADDAVPNQLVIYSATYALLVECARERPVLLIVDDLQWVDSLTLQTVAFIARRARGLRLAVVITGRPEATLPGFEGDFVELAPLDRSAVATLADRLLGRRLPAGAVDQLATASSGNPLAIAEIVRQLGPELGQRGGLLDAPLPATAMIERGFEQLLAAQPPNAIAAAKLLAESLNDGIDVLQVALTALGVSPSALEEAKEAGLVVVERGRVRFAHPVLRTLVHRQADAAERRACHAALATAMPDGSPLAAWHTASAATEPDEPTAAALAAAAEGFGVLGGHFAEAQALSRAASLTPDPERAAQRLIAAGIAAHASGRTGWSLELVTRGEALSQNPRTRAAATFERLCAEAHLQGVDDLPQRLAALASELADVDPDLAAEVLMQAIVEIAISGQGDMFAAVGLLTQRLEPRIQTEYARSQFLAARSYAALAGGDAAAQRLAEQTTVELADAAVRGGRTPALLDELLLSLERYDIAAPLIERACEDYRARGNVLRLGATLWARGLLAMEIGEWDAAEAHLREARSMVDGTEQADLLVPIVSIACRLGAARGDRAIVDELAALAPLARRYRYGVYDEWAGDALGLLELSLGQPAAAIPHLERARNWAPARSPVLNPNHGRWPTDLVEAYVLTGRSDDAAALLEEVREFAAVSARPSVAAALHRLDGLVAADDAFEPEFRAALERYAEIRQPFEEARTRLAFGERLSRVRRSAEAAEQLAHARDMFTALDAPPWVAKVDALLGGRARAEPSGDELTPQERQVAELVAAGATNKQAASELFVSPKTIEAHLSRIYRKLGVTSRTQLAAQLARSHAGGRAGLDA